MKKSNQIIVDILVMLFALIVGVGGWVYLFMNDWRIALCITGILWGREIANKYKDKY